MLVFPTEKIQKIKYSYEKNRETKNWTLLKYNYFTLKARQNNNKKKTSENQNIINLTFIKAFLRLK